MLFLSVCLISYSEHSTPKPTHDLCMKEFRFHNGSHKLMFCLIAYINHQPAQQNLLPAYCPNPGRVHQELIRMDFLQALLPTMQAFADLLKVLISETATLL